MTIPDDLKIYSMVYEYRHFVLLPLTALWIAGGFYLLFRLKKVFFLWLLIFPLVISPLQIAFTYCGWRYRMELRDRFAADKRGWSDEFTYRPVNINLMPPEIHAEYAKHDYHPRFRDMKAMMAGTVVFTPLLYFAGGLVYLWIFLFRQWSEKRKIPTVNLHESSSVQL